MGCDIHLWIETRLNKESEWTVDTFHEVIMDEEDEPEGRIGVEPEYGTRNYRMFGALAGVRYSDSILFEERGLPKDISRPLAIEADQWGIDGHSHSWLTLDEFKKCIDQEDHKDGEYVAVYNMAMTWLVNEAAEQQLLSTGWEPAARVVFWFDN